MGVDKMDQFTITEESRDNQTMPKVKIVLGIPIPGQVNLTSLVRSA
jgi:hypothetical protein